jgi:hypothetical protein
MNRSDAQDPFESRVNLKHLVLMLILLGLLLLRPLVPGPIADAVFLPTIIAAAWLAGGKTGRGLIVTVLLGLAAFGLLLFDLFAHEQLQAFMRTPVGLPVAAVVLFIFLYCGGVILHSLLTAERVFANEIIGTFNIYLIMGFTWAYIYMILEQSAPGSFQTVSASENIGLRFIYFSFITLTTVGFGDTVPATPFAQMVVILEAIVGQFYVAVVVAYLVSMYITHEIMAGRK